MTDKPSNPDASRLYHALRFVREVSDTQNTATENSPQSLESFRDAPAWVLLGEPGAGKSTAFKTEAEATGGVCIPISRFIGRDNAERKLRGKTLFLDGLDEFGADRESTLHAIYNKLDRLDNPKFRIACRAADWRGSLDRDEIKDAAQDKKIALLLLQPLGDGDVLDILRENHSIANPENFVKEAQKRGIYGLLNNPQTLELLAKATLERSGELPATRKETYESACLKLAAENNERYQDKPIEQSIDVAPRLNAAGQLCAVLLLSNRMGITRLSKNKQLNFPCVRDFSPPDSAAANQVLRSTLFRPIDEKYLEPVHRTIAEFLAARWLGQQVKNGLPLKRVLNLLLGCDGRTVAGLRGLYAWLALECKGARTQLIQADPFTVVIYGDVSPMSIVDKRMTLQGLKQESERFHSFRWQAQSAYPFGALAAKELIPDFIAALTSPDRREAAQSFADCVLDILAEGQALPELLPIVKEVILDATRWDTVRNRALSVWLKYQVGFDELLSDIVKNESEQNDKLAGTLLHHLYPSQIDATALLWHLDIRQGISDGFWVHGEPENVPNTDLSILLDSLAQKTPQESYTYSSHLSGNLLVRWLETDGNRVSDEKLFVWLNHPVVGSIPNQPYSFCFSGRALPKVICNHEKVVLWLKDRPDCYKVLLRKWYQQSSSRFHRSQFFSDLELLRNTAEWHLEQASQTNDVALGHKLLEGFIHLSQQNMDGFTLEKLIAWGGNHPKYEHWLNEKSSAINERRQRKERQNREEATRQFEENQKQVEFKKQLAIELIHEKVHIHTGSASLATMLKLVSMWGDAFGKTPTENFDHYFGEDAEEMLIAAEAGFFAFLGREDIPSIAEIIKGGKMGHEYKIRIPCFIGMELYYSRNSVATLSDETLLKMFAFWFPRQNRAYWKPKWVEWLHSQRPQLIELYLDTELSLPLDGQNIAHLLTLHEYPSLKSKLIELAKRKAQLAEVTLSWQDIPWLVCATCFFSEQKEVLLWEHLDKQPKHFRVVDYFLNSFSNDDLFSLFEANSFSASNLSQLIVRYFELAPSDVDAATDDETRNFFFQTRQFISYLAALGTDQAAQEIEGLLIRSDLNSLKYPLQDALHQLKLTQREQAFAFLPPAKVAQILANQAPISSADLAVLAETYLGTIAYKIRHGNDNYRNHFWSAPRENWENVCRNLLLTRLRDSFQPLGVECEPEAYYAEGKRADIRLSYRNEFEVPIEVKGEWHPDLWTAAKTQLMRLYSRAPKANGYGIYLVVWFGGKAKKGKKGVNKPTDGGEVPTSAGDLKNRLENTLDSEARKQIFVFVLDVTSPSQQI